MAAKYWLKLYYEMLDDPKMGKLRPALRWRFVECLLVAGECDEGGYIPGVTEYAWRVRDNAESVETDFVQLAEGGLLSQDGGQWFVTKFAERQAAVTDAERMKRYRERKRKAEYYGDDTKVLPDSYESVTKRNTDTDKIRIDTDKIGASAPSSNGRADIFGQAGSKAVVQWWTKLVGCGKPQDRNGQLYEPAEALLERLDQDVPEAKRLLEEKRGWMIKEKGWTPKWLSGVVPHILAELDSNTIDLSSPIDDFKVYNDPQT